MDRRSALSGAPSLDGFLTDPAASFALKSVLLLWLSRDCVDAARDARVLAQLLEGRAAEVLGRGP